MCVCVCVCVCVSPCLCVSVCVCECLEIAPAAPVSARATAPDLPCSSTMASSSSSDPAVAAVALCNPAAADASPSVAAASCQRGVKRAASEVKRATNQAELSFDSVWFAVQKHARSGAQAELGSLADVLRLTGSQRAKSTKHDVGGRIQGWQNRFNWTEGRDYDREVAAFRARSGGGYQGVGLTCVAARQVYDWCTDA